MRSRLFGKSCRTDLSITVGCTLYSGVVSDDRTVIYRLKETLRIGRARKGVQVGKELRDDRVDQAGRWGKECRSTMLKVAVIGVMGALLALLLKGKRQDKVCGLFWQRAF